MISLCVICGNEERLICRLLDSFSPAFDELSIVRAVGSNPPDATESLAREWCEKNGKAYVFSEYKNVSKKPLPHVDDFSAARNLSFDKASGDWKFWADCDDVISNALELRGIIESQIDPCLISFSYEVLGTCKCPVRERAVHASLSVKWEGAIHEVLRPIGEVRFAVKESPVWIHQPSGCDQNVNRNRNLAILSSTLRNAATNYFYVHQEHFVAGRKDQAEKFGKIALSLPNLEPSFRYAVLINLARQSRDVVESYRYACEARGVFPWCREAVAMLVATSFDLGNKKLATHYAKELIGIPLPHFEDKPWTHEPKWYGWAGRDLYLRALRFDGSDEAISEMNTMINSGAAPMISLIHATRGREQRAIESREVWMEAAKDADRIEHIFVVDRDDEQGAAVFRQFGAVISDGGGCVAAWNAGARASRGKVLVQLSDDWVPPYFWDETILSAIGDRIESEAVLAVGDGHRHPDDGLLCMAIMTRARYVAQGCEMFSSEYADLFSDNEFSYRAFRDGVVIDRRRDVAFFHDHPIFTGKPLDETYRRHNNPLSFARGMEVFKRRNPEIKNHESTVWIHD